MPRLAPSMIALLCAALLAGCRPPEAAERPPPSPASAVEIVTTTALPAPPAAAAPSPADDFAQRVVELVNVERAKVTGCPALAVSGALVAAAERHNSDMAASGFFDHAGSDGSDVGERATAAGYRWRLVGENIAAGQASPERVMAGWMDSQGHRENILNCAFREIGVSYISRDGSPYTRYWTQVFGAPQ